MSFLKASTPGLKSAASILSLAVATSVHLGAAAQTSVFLNEIHYDNVGSDTGEFIEIAGPAGTNLSGWTAVLYNGNGGGAYDTVLLSGSLPNQDNGYGTLSFARAGIQNGSPDGLALIDSSGAVVQFVSYEGSFTATDGPANGMDSVDIGVFEASDTAIGLSLQLTGTGFEFDDFNFAPPSAETPDLVNTGQVFDTPTGSPPPPPTTETYVFINELHYDNAGSDVGEFVEIAGPAGTSLSGWSIELYNGSNGSLYDTIDLTGTDRKSVV